MNDALTADQMYSMIVGLVRNCDASLVEPEFLRQMDIPSRYHQPLMALRDQVQRLIEDYDYLQSSAFLRSVADRSEEFRTMRKKLESEPQKRAAHARAFSDALVAIRRNNCVHDLLSPTQHHRLDAIRDLIASMDEP
jgi:hypothetical protein